jgi:aerobic carbon-monoxide dehydrogenase medium subunit
MHPPPFTYLRADSVDQALRLAQEHPEARFLAGGHSLIPIMKMRLADPGVLIDIGRIAELNGLSHRADGRIYIAALTRHAELAAAPQLPRALTEAALAIGDPQVRNCGTIGGSLAHADPASDLPPALLILEALLHLEGPRGRRQVAAADFFIDLFTTALDDGELITGVELPPFDPAMGSAYVKLANPASGYATVGVAAAVELAGGLCRQVRVAVGGVGPKPIRALTVEAVLQNQLADPAVIAAAAAAVEHDLGDQVLSDIQASAEYRKSMAVVFVRRAIEAAGRRARERQS